MNKFIYHVYIMASKRNGTLYAGITSSLEGRVWQHKQSAVDGFTKKYGVHMLVYYEEFDYVYDAIAREKQIKSWSRGRKIRLIESVNPRWKDLASDF